MDGINRNYSQFATNFATKLGQINESAAAQATGAVDQSQEVSSASQVRIGESKDKVAYVQSHPELAKSANLTSDERAELLESTSDKIVSGEIKCRGNRVMFDIYSVLALIQETAQEMRNAQRDLRKAEVATITSSILAQAAMQRAAAYTQLIAGCVTAGISAAMTIGSIKGAYSELKATRAAQNAAGLPQMETQQALTTAEGNPNLARTNLQAQETGLLAQDKAGIKSEVMKDMNEAGLNQPFKAQTEKASAEQELAGANEGVKAAEAKVKSLNDQVEGPRNGGGNDLNPDGEDGSNLLLSEEDMDGINRVDVANKELADAKSLSDVAKAKVGEADAKLQTEVDSRAAKLEQVVDKYQEKFDMATAKATAEFRRDGTVKDATMAEVKDAGLKLNYARALQLDSCARMPKTPQTDVSAFSKVNASVMHAKNASLPPEARFDAFASQMMGQTVQVVNNLGSAIGQSISGLFQAEGTELQAEQRQAEEQLDQMKDLFNNTQQVIQQAIQIFQSVTSKESQSIEEIIGGIKA